MRCSLSIAGLHTAAARGPWSDGGRGAIEWAAGLGFRAVQLDASAPETRPRHLDRSARRDLAATLRRHELAFTGVDLWIPPEHYADPARGDRALSVLLGTVEFAAEIGGLVGGAGPGGPVVSVTLPPGYHAIQEIDAVAGSAGVAVEDFTASRGDEGPDDAAPRPPSVHPGLDTARLLMRGLGPGKVYAAAANRLASLRLNDADDTGRRVMGTGRLEAATLIALHQTLTPALPIMTDLRGLDNPDRAAKAAHKTLGSTGL